MDNLTHTLIGYTLGHSLFSKAEPKLKTAALWTAILGNNIPDIDTFVIPFFSSGKLDYLLHHRGYSHTFISALPLGVTCAALGASFSGMKVAQNRNLITLGIGSVLMHIGADSWNNYGVHPFSPFWNRWFYGDFLFILEPLLWFSLLPFAFYTVRSRILKGLIVSVVFALITLLWSGKFNPWPVALGATLWVCLFFLLQYQIKTVKPALMGAITVLLSFFLGSHWVRSELRTFLIGSGQNPDAQSWVTSPSPANPFCWSVITLNQANGTYSAKLGTISILPKVFPPRSCFLKGRNERTIPLSTVTLPDHPGVYWVGEFKKPYRDFQDLLEQNCWFKAFTHFARIPIWYQNGEMNVAGDLRYDHEKGRGFSLIDLNSKNQCPQFLPPWIPPTHCIDDSC